MSVAKFIMRTGSRRILQADRNNRVEASVFAIKNSSVGRTYFWELASPCFGSRSSLRHYSNVEDASLRLDVKVDQLNVGMTESTKIKNVKTFWDEKAIEIEWSDDGASAKLFPFVWLRDHCQCEHCFHPAARSRTMQFDDLALDVTPIELKARNECVLEIIWSDGHTSVYDSNWLLRRGFERSITDCSRPSAYRLKKIGWGSEIWEDLPTANFREIMTDDVALLTWLQQLEAFGFVLIQNASTDYGEVKKLTDRVAFTRKTHYGKEFVVKAKQEPSNVAYSNGPLQLHTDLPYYEYKPCVQLIHCIVQLNSVGGESLIANAEHVAMELKKIQPHMFRTLSETKVDFTDVGEDEEGEFYKVFSHPVIRLDDEGNIRRINMSHPQRDSFFNVDFKTVFKWYEAFKTFHNMLYDPRYCLQFKMTPGTIQSFDNLRIVHGRKGYEHNSGPREIEGCYMDWDEVRSKRRVLETRLNLSSTNWWQQRGSFKKLPPN